MKQCSKCQKMKPYSEYHRRGEGIQDICKPCNVNKVRAWQEANPDRVKLAAERSKFSRTLSPYGLTPEDFETLSQVSGGGCFICGDLPSGRRHAVDHDHLTGRVRGILCHKCNRGLGLFEDNIEKLQAAIDYLRSEPPIERFVPSESLPNEWRPTRKSRKKSEKACAVCGSLNLDYLKRCRECPEYVDARKSGLIRKKKGDWPEVEEIIRDISNLGYSGAGAKYGVSDNAVRKHLMRLGVKLPPARRGPKALK